MNLHIWAALPLIVQALRTNNSMTQVIGMKGGRQTMDMIQLNLKEGFSGETSPVAAAGQPGPPSLLSVSVFLSFESRTY